MSRCTLCFTWLLVLLLPINLMAQPLFDAHLHYSADDAVHFSPQDIISKLDNNGITHALVNGTPIRYTEALYRHAPDRIIPLLGIYHGHADKNSWTRDSNLPDRVRAHLQDGIWRGIGELHIFAAERHSPVFRRLIEIAAVHRMPLQLHADPAVIDTVYDIAPSQTVIWAHAGTYPYPDLLADYLARYPALYVDLSMRDERIAPDGKLADEWHELFLTYPTRFMVGVDTYSVPRWQQFDSAVATLRGWLAQLPVDIASQFAYNNAARLFLRPRRSAGTQSVN